MSRMSILPGDCPTGGCGAKMGPADLARCLAGLPVQSDPDLLTGFEHADDAAVYKLSDEIAVVSTVDFFPPMVDDPLAFGRIAAANALSDVFAMGARAVMALNLVCFPEKWDKAILRDILAGGAEKIRESGAALAGGHSIHDSGLKYGLAVTGVVQPGRQYQNHTGREGDCLILTKSLGVGLILSAARVGLAKPMELTAAVLGMERLNKYAAEKLPRFSVHAVTDVTGFGLLGHAVEMAGQAMSLTIDYASLPILPGALRHAGCYLATAAGQRNRNHLEGLVDVRGIGPAEQEILFDPQTSGGLLISVAAAEAEVLCQAIRQDDPAAAIIGQVIRREEYAVTVV